ncbi:MAG: hypothetical protein NT002_00280 [candidate division Zixibacteria bacterium]|nr:hypothetical protein [candidate division Zixibacteria bacterium]
MSAAEKQILANRANAQESTGPRTGRRIAASSNWATAPNQPGRKKESFKNGETNPFCRMPPVALKLLPYRRVAPNLLIVSKAQKILKTKPNLSNLCRTYAWPFLRRVRFYVAKPHLLWHNQLRLQTRPRHGGLLACTTYLG